jgi:hypothetical protein
MANLKLHSIYFLHTKSVVIFLLPAKSKHKSRCNANRSWGLAIYAEWQKNFEFCSELLVTCFIFKGLFWMPPQQPCTTCKTPSLTSVSVSQLGGSIMIPAVTDTGMSSSQSYTDPHLHADNVQPWHYLQYTMLQPLSVPHILCDTQLPQLLNIHKILSSICACTPVSLSHSIWHLARPCTCSCLVLSNSVFIVTLVPDNIQLTEAHTPNSTTIIRQLNTIHIFTIPL